MYRGLLDSDTLSEIMKGFNNLVSENAAEYLREHRFLSFTSMTVYEILFGYLAKPAPTQAKRFIDLVSVHEEILPDKNDYRLAAEIRAALKLSGREIGRADPLIAGCALRRKLTLITNNERHYGYIV